MRLVLGIERGLSLGGDGVIFTGQNGLRV